MKCFVSEVCGEALRGLFEGSDLASYAAGGQRRTLFQLGL